ncbi:hypothetical protein LTS63_15660 [Mycobacterium intracellulare]|nr:hypothetical protein [Mycobacterium intracellulare]UGU00407.1 hypothetical protein LTS63_15660 [Mycobacterium intracellulare]
MITVSHFHARFPDDHVADDLDLTRQPNPARVGPADAPMEVVKQLHLCLGPFGQ